MLQYVDELLEETPTDEELYFRYCNNKLSKFGWSIEAVMKLKRRISQLEFIVSEMYKNIGTKDEREDYMTADELAQFRRLDGTYPVVSFSSGFDSAAIAADIRFHGSHFD